jgi:hypothetical protein
LYREGSNGRVPLYGEGSNFRIPFLTEKGSIFTEKDSNFKEKGYILQRRVTFLQRKGLHFYRENNYNGCWKINNTFMDYSFSARKIMNVHVYIVVFLPECPPPTKKCSIFTEQPYMFLYTTIPLLKAIVEL